MVIFILDKDEIEIIRIQEIDEENNDLRIGVWDLKKDKLIKIFSQDTDIKEIENFGDNYVKENNY